MPLTVRQQGAAGGRLLGLQAHALQRVGWLALAVSGAVLVYFLSLSLAGVNLRQFVRK